MYKWLKISLGVFLILLPDPTLITDAIGFGLVAGTLWSLSRRRCYAYGPCRCYSCTTGLRPSFWPQTPYRRKRSLP